MQGQASAAAERANWRFAPESNSPAQTILRPESAASAGESAHAQLPRAAAVLRSTPKVCARGTPRQAPRFAIPARHGPDVRHYLFDPPPAMAQRQCLPLSIAGSTNLPDPETPSAAADA